MVSRYLCGLMWLVLITHALPSAAATLLTSTDRDTLHQNEYLMLTFTLQGSDTRLRGDGIKPNIDLSRLTGDFELGPIVTRHRFTLANGQGQPVSTLQLALFPRRSGSLLIPSYQLENGRSRPLQIRVLDPVIEAAPEVFVRSGATELKLLPQQATLAYLDLYSRVPLKTARLGAALDATSHALSVEILPARDSSTLYHGHQYQVTRSAWRVSAARSGPVTLTLPDIWIETAAGRRLRLPVSRVRLNITEPVNTPPSGVPVGTVQIRQTTFDAPLIAGQSYPWQVVIRSTAPLSALPQQLPAQTLPPQLMVYIDRSERHIDDSRTPVESVVEYTGYLMARGPGEFLLPEIRLSYFDPQHGAVRAAVAPAQRLQVQAATASSPATLSGAADQHTPAPTAMNWRRSILSALLTALALTLLALWWQRHRSRPRNQQPLRSQQPALSAALLAALPGRTLDEGLSQWQTQHGPDTELQQLVLDLQRYYYGRDKRPDGEAALSHRVSEMVQRLHDRQRVTQPPASDDRWSPRSFTPGGQSGDQ